MYTVLSGLVETKYWSGSVATKSEIPVTRYGTQSNFTSLFKEMLKESRITHQGNLTLDVSGCDAYSRYTHTVKSRQWSEIVQLIYNMHAWLIMASKISGSTFLGLSCQG